MWLRISKFTFSLVALALCACGPARRTDYVPLELAAKYCKDQKAAYDIGYYLAKRNLPLVKPEMIDDCSEKTRGPAEAAYRAGIARAQTENNCDPKSADAQGVGDGEKLVPARPEQYCSDRELLRAYAVAYEIAYRRGASQLCDATIANVKNQGADDGVRGSQNGISQELLNRCPSERRAQMQAAYVDGLKQGEIRACDMDIENAKSAGKLDGYSGKKYVPPESKRCPSARSVELVTAYKNSYDAGQVTACQDEILNVQKLGNNHGYENKNPSLPSMMRCPEARFKEFELAYRTGVVNGQRQACQEELVKAAELGASDARDQKPPYPPGILRCPASAIDALSGAYLEAFSRTKDQLMSDACPKDSEAYARGLSDGKNGTPAYSLPDAGPKCVEKYFDKVNTAYLQGVADGKRQLQAQSGEREGQSLGASDPSQQEPPPTREVTVPINQEVNIEIQNPPASPVTSPPASSDASPAVGPGVPKGPDSVPRPSATNPSVPVSPSNPHPQAPNTLTWVAASNGKIPPQATPGGNEQAPGNQPLFVCRAFYAGRGKERGVHPGRLRTDLKGCIIGYGGAELTLPQYEVLVGKLNWAAASGGAIPRNAVMAGQEGPQDGGESFVVCRANFPAGSSGKQIGKLRKTLGGCRFGWGGKELTATSYEVLITVP